MDNKYFAYGNVSYNISTDNPKLLFKLLKKQLKLFCKEIHKAHYNEEDLNWLMREYIWTDLCITHTYLHPSKKYYYTFTLDDKELNVYVHTEDNND